MPESTDNFYTFSAAELAQIKADYSQLLADQHAHNAQFQKRNQLFHSLQMGVIIATLVNILMIFLVILMSYVLGRFLFPFILILNIIVVIFGTAIFIVLKKRQYLDQQLLREFPTVPVRYDRASYLKPFHIRQMIKLPDYLILWPIVKELHIIPTPDQASCWIIRRSDQPGAYQKLPAMDYNDLLKNHKASRWIDYLLVDGTKEA
ncbi:hypothetical protein [Oenococcus sicerae]|uniref:Uncharacterized protein n=1 Tax=Oenococcus sicerae TaxID=2203724 RepID=A0AAJ1VMI0_9LACO|nr:hypothetical protein [Oenococcus sicerae]MDN6900593.1 hypothetical protein [Oenococcus sicerae]